MIDDDNWSCCGSGNDSWPKSPGFESRISGGRIFSSRVSFLCWLLFRYPFHPPGLPLQHVKDPGHSANSTGVRLQINIHAPYVCCFEWRHCKPVHRCMVFTELAPRWQQFHVAPAMQQPNSAVSTPLRLIKRKEKSIYKKVRCMIDDDNWLHRVGISMLINDGNWLHRWGITTLQTDHTGELHRYSLMMVTDHTGLVYQYDTLITQVSYIDIN